VRPHRDHHRSGLHDLAVDADAATVDIELAGGESDALAQHSPEPATSRTCSSRHHSFVRSAATLATAWTASKVGISTRVTARSTGVTSTSCQRRALEITDSVRVGLRVGGVQITPVPGVAKAVWPTSLWRD
jgi:hypothetical protein